MKEYDIDLTAENPVEISLADDANETHALIRIISIRRCDALQLTKINAQGGTPSELPPKEYNQIDLVGYSKFLIGAKLQEDSILKIEVCTGSWEEMLLKEIDSSLSKFYINCSADRKDFQIGKNGTSTIKVMQDDEGGFSVVTEIVHGPRQTSGIKNYLSKESDARIANSVYTRIKSVVVKPGFLEGQEQNTDALAKHLEERVREGFHPIAREVEG